MRRNGNRGRGLVVSFSAPAKQQQHADLWLTWAQDWGYDQLELRGQDGSLLGREARVGGGMILGFSP